MTEADGTSPSTITNYPKRWSAPQIRGKRIAMYGTLDDNVNYLANADHYSDGTLLTNRFHFAIQDGPLKGKGGLVGWFKYVPLVHHSIA